MLAKAILPEDMKRKGTAPPFYSAFRVGPVHALLKIQRQAAKQKILSLAWHLAPGILLDSSRSSDIQYLHIVLVPHDGDRL